MTSIFLFALILGGGLLAVSLLGDLFGGGDVDLDGDFDGLDAELGADVDADLGGGVDAGEVGSTLAVGDAPTDLASAIRIFSIRNLTYFLFAFGGIGWLLVRFGPALPMAAITALALLGGLSAAGLAALLFGWLRATDSGGQADEASFVGCEGRVLLPVGHGKMGQVVVRRGDREHELRALPFDDRAGSPERWLKVIVIEMDGGTARVSPIEALAPADSGPAEP